MAAGSGWWCARTARGIGCFAISATASRAAWAWAVCAAPAWRKPRERADAARRKLAAGLDPINDRIGARQQEAAAAAQLRTVREVAALFFAKHEGRWSKERDWKRSLDLYVHPVIGNVAIADVGVPHVLKCVEPHWQRIPETARRVLGRLEELIDYARIAGLRRDDSNPAKWNGGLDAVLPPPSKIKPTEHHAAMHYRDVPGLHGQAARRAGRRRPRLGISDPDRHAHERNALRDMGRGRGRCVDRSGRADEDAQGASRAALAPRRRDPARNARPASPR